MRLLRFNQRGAPVTVEHLRRVTGATVLLLLLLLISVSAPSAVAKTRASTSLRTVASHPAPTGDATAIAFNYQVQRAYRSVKAVTVTRRGYLSYTDAGPATSYNYAWGEPAPFGYRLATESLLYLLRGGRVTTFVDRAHAAGMLRLTLIQNAGGSWGRTGSSCYSHPRASLKKLSGLGQNFSLVYGQFAPLQQSGDTTIVNVRYRWGSTAWANETDRVSTATKLVRSWHISVSNGVVISEILHYPVTPPIASAPTPGC